MAVAYISSEHPSENIEANNIVEYSTRYMLSALPDEGHVTKRMLLEAAGQAAIEVYEPVRISSGTAIPYFISIDPYPLLNADSFIFTRLIATNPQPRPNDIQIDEVYDGSTFTGWNINGHDNGSGGFNEITEVVFPTFYSISTGGSGGAYTPPTPIDDATSLGYATNSDINAAYPAAKQDQKILCANVPTQYIKLDNSPTGSWDEQPYNPLT